jgi:glycosyltransferase involved in cell wall biosynthesis
VGGILDVMRDRETGFIIPVNDPESVVTVLEEVFANDELRAKVGNAARNKIVQEFTPEKEISANLRLYKDIQHSFGSR